jgi:hypothetical protein
MHSERIWISSEALAQVAGITVQAARSALRRARDGIPWRGHKLEVSLSPGRGGRGGVAYQVAAETLPTELLNSLSDIGPAPTRRAVHGQEEKIRRRWTTVAEAVIQRHGSQAREAAIDDAAAATGHHRRTIERWISRYEAHGLRGLAHRRPTNAGRPRVHISRKSDSRLRALGLGERALKELATELDESLKGLWASRAAHAGSREIGRLAVFLLRERCEAQGLIVSEQDLSSSRRRVERFAHFRVVNQRKNDRKAFDDGKPRVRRDWTELAPLERVVADVKHLDVIVARPDGALAWPKIVAFMDLGTSRVFLFPVLAERGEGVRQEHVIEAFIAMVSDAAWGFPRGFYLDNGAEFAALLRIEGALNALNDGGVRSFIFARPYNASAKPIESLFARLDRYVFSLLPGYAGPDRLAKKTQTVGQPPAPYPGSWEDFKREVLGLTGAFNNQPVGGQWADKSPAQWLEAKVDAGWRPTHVDPLELDAAFCDHDSRRIDRGVIRYRGERYSHPALAALPHRRIVDLAVPWRRGAPPLAKIPEQGWVALEREMAVPGRWQQGARLSARRQKAYEDTVARMAGEAPTIDPVATKIRWGEARAKQIAVPPHPAKVDLGTGPVPGEPQPSPTTPQAQKKADKLERDMARTERLERKYRRYE